MKPEELENLINNADSASRVLRKGNRTRLLQTETDATRWLAKIGYGHHMMWSDGLREISALLHNDRRRVEPITVYAREVYIGPLEKWPAEGIIWDAYMFYRD